MDIRPATPADLERLLDIDGTIESTEYLHLERTGESLSIGWKLEQRHLRSKLIEANPLSDEQKFLLKQILSGADEGIVLVAEHEEAPVALAMAQVKHEHGTLNLLDIRVDFDLRRQGLATVMIYQIIQAAKDQSLRAVSTETRTSNVPANKLFQKLAFEMTGVDTHRHSNHDMVKESATIFWYAALD